jgi:hypothetical protein
MAGPLQVVARKVNDFTHPKGEAERRAAQAKRTKKVKRGSPGKLLVGAGGAVPAFGLCLVVFYSLLNHIADHTFKLFEIVE